MIAGPFTVADVDENAVVLRTSSGKWSTKKRKRYMHVGDVHKFI